MDEPILRQIQEALRSIRYGSIEIVIHDSKIVQIERKEKLRLADQGRTTELTGRPEVP